MLVFGYLVMIALGSAGILLFTMVIWERLRPRKGIGEAIHSFWVGLILAGLWMASWVVYIGTHYTIVVKVLP